MFICFDGFMEILLFYEIFVVYMFIFYLLMDKDWIDFEDFNIEDMWLLQEGYCFCFQVVNICSEQQEQYMQWGLCFESGSLEIFCCIVEWQYGYILLLELAILELFEELYNKYVCIFCNL